MGKVANRGKEKRKGRKFTFCDLEPVFEVAAAAFLPSDSC